MRENDCSPEWIIKIARSYNAKQLFVIAGMKGSTALVSMHERNQFGNYMVILSTYGFIGANGLGKTKEGDWKTPIGVFCFNQAFGIAKNPGSNIPYTQIDNSMYWSGDIRTGKKYNQLVSIDEIPDLDTEKSEHLIKYRTHYQYCLNISYNDAGIQGKGSAIFLHCFGQKHNYTGGCVAIAEGEMIKTMRHVKKECIVVIDTLENLGGRLF